jgi:hypothetical protein
MKSILFSAISPVLTLVIPLLAGFFANRLTDLLKMVSGVLDKAPAAVKQLVVVVLAGGLVMAGNVLGIQLDPSAVGSDLSIDKAALEALIAATLAFLLKNGQQTKKIEAKLAGVTNNPFDLSKGTFDPGA